MRGMTQTMEALEILEAGLLTTVQDAGRCGWLRYGVPPSGPLDAVAFQAANVLVGNPPEAAGLEITWSGPTLRITRDALVAVCGADFEPGSLPDAAGSGRCSGAGRPSRAFFETGP